MIRSALLVLLALGSAPVFGQVPDHLRCYRVRDTLARATYTADLGGLVTEPGCLIETPAKMLCVETAKTNVAPAPPGAPSRPAAGTFACYKVKCARGPYLPVTIADQFGNRPAKVTLPRLLCAPVGVGSTTTTEPTSTTTSTIVAAPCDDGQFPECNGSCPAAGRCLASVGQGCARPSPVPSVPRARASRPVVPGVSPAPAPPTANAHRAERAPHPDLPFEHHLAGGGRRDDERDRGTDDDDAWAQEATFDAIGDALRALRAGAGSVTTKSAM